MCGITGIRYFEADRRVDPRVLDRMTDVLAHRGPDGRGIHVEGALGLGHRRLAIIDLSPAAAQPMANEDGSVLVVFNGEIYNFRDLRDELVDRGHRFRSHCDVEVLVHLYEEAGDGMVERLRGMFAFALWDARRGRLLLARDRFGQKPLYYRITERRFHFGSEIKAILEDLDVPRRVDPRSLDAFLTYGYVPGPATAFAGIRKLPPAHLLTVEADGRHQLRRYWRLEVHSDAEAAVDSAARRRAEERVLELLDEATRLRMISDVPLGALLSGGIDSSAVVASMCAARRGATPVKTFSLGFREPAFDESLYAAVVARHLGTEHHRLELTPAAFAGLERIAWHHDEPFADPSCLPTFAVAGLARRHVTVALTGDGGDELFCGYRRYAAVRLEEKLRSAPAALRTIARSPGLGRLLRGARRRALAEELDRSRRFRDLPLAEGYVARLEVMAPGVKAGLYDQPGFGAKLEGWDARRSLLLAIASSDGREIAARCAHADVLTYLPDDILVKVDVASMAHGLECRAPLLDHVLAEYVAGLPFRLKMRRWKRKAVLKGAVAARLPRATLERGKRGFNLPLESWLRGRLEPLLRESLLSRRAAGRGYFDPAAVAGLIDEHAGGRANHQAPLFCLLMLELWHRQWIDPAAGSQPEHPVPAAAV